MDDHARKYVLACAEVHLTEVNLLLQCPQSQWLYVPAKYIPTCNMSFVMGCHRYCIAIMVDTEGSEIHTGSLNEPIKTDVSSTYKPCNTS